MSWKIKCPYCSTGYVGPLMGGLRDDYYGRQRLCGSCGTIWRMSYRGYRIMIGSVLLVFSLGVAALYYHHWLPQVTADVLAAVWLEGLASPQSWEVLDLADRPSHLHP